MMHFLQQKHFFLSIAPKLNKTSHLQTELPWFTNFRTKQTAGSAGRAPLVYSAQLPVNLLFVRAKFEQNNHFLFHMFLLIIKQVTFLTSSISCQQLLIKYV